MPPNPGNLTFDPNTKTYIDITTGNRYADREGTPAPKNVPQSGGDSVFNPDYLNKAKLQPNPFKPGTREYNDFKNSQIKNLVDKAGAPEIPDFVSQLDENGRMRGPYQLSGGSVTFRNILPQISENINGVNIDQRGLNEIRNRALATGESPWLRMQLEKQGLNELEAIEQAKQQMAGNQAQAEGSLAMRGGLSSGARERLARSGASNSLGATQGLRRGGQQDRLGLQIADDQTKTNLLTQLPGMEQNIAQFNLGKQTYLGDLAKQQQGVDLEAQKYNSDQQVGAQKYNIGNALNEILSKRAYDQGKYSELMKTFAAGKTADAQANAGKK